MEELVSSGDLDLTRCGVNRGGRIVVVSENAPGGFSAELRRRGFVVDGVQCLEGRIAEAAAGDCELIVLCLDSSFRDPVELCTRLRKNSVAMPIVVLAERMPHDVQLALLRADVDQCVTHDCAVDELVERVCLVLRRCESLTTRRLEVGDLYVNDDEQRAYLRGAPLELTSREFAVLRHLVLRVGRVASRSELRAAIWHAQEPLESNVIEVLVGRVRKKLGSAGLQLRTVRGRGYTLSPLRGHEVDVQRASSPAAEE